MPQDRTRHDQGDSLFPGAFAGAVVIALGLLFAWFIVSATWTVICALIQ